MYETLIQYFPVRHGGADHHEKIDAGSWANRHQSLPPSRAGDVVLQKAAQGGAVHQVRPECSDVNTPFTPVVP